MTISASVDLQPVHVHTPMCLRDRRQWVAWKYIERDGKPTKSPIDPRTGAFAKSTDSATWGTFDDAIAACARFPGLGGVGFVFTPDDPYCGVDLDDSLDAGGALKEWAAAIVDQLASYSEVSPSGTGVKVFLKASKPGARCRKAHADGEVEIYDRDRFFTVTGQRLPRSPAAIETRQEQLDAVYRAVFGDDAGADRKRSSAATATDSVRLDDDEIIELASRQRRSGGKFATLWSGDWNAHFNSASEADSSVVFTLAFYTKDAAQIDRLFRRSGLMRPKWDELHGERSYGDSTVAKALAKVTKQYKPPTSRKGSRAAAQPPTKSGLPSIVLDDEQLRELTGLALAAIRQSNDPPAVFVRGGQLARVVSDENGAPSVETFDRVRMRCRLSEVANFFAVRKIDDSFELVGTNPPLSLAENVLAQTSWSLPPLAGIARAPILRHDGTIHTQPGYDPVSRLVYRPDPELALAPIPEYPDINEVHACVDLLMKVIGDFPFADAPSRANALAILFSLLMRPVITGHVPLAIIDAPMQGTGKTLLVTALGMIAAGSVASESIPSKDNDDEWRKKITSILLAASSFVLLDNIPDNTTIDSPPLAAALTSSEWSDRLLGRNNAIRLPSRVVWAATGNNLRVAGDMPRRSYSIRLDANAERPWERTGFQIKGLERHVRAHRGDLLSAALTIVRAWYTNGKPAAPVPTLGSFEEWSETIGGVLAFAGVEGFLGNLEQTQIVQDEDTQQWTAFFDAWWEEFGSTPAIVDEVCERLIEDDVHGVRAARTIPDSLLVHLDVHGVRAHALRKSLGRHLSRLSGRIFNGHKLLHAGSDAHRKIRRWKLAGFVTPQENANPAANPAEKGLW